GGDQGPARQPAAAGESAELVDPVEAEADREGEAEVGDPAGGGIDVDVERALLVIRGLLDDRGPARLRGGLGGLEGGRAAADRARVGGDEGVREGVTELDVVALLSGGGSCGVSLRRHRPERLHVPGRAGHVAGAEPGSTEERRGGVHLPVATAVGRWTP